MARIRNIVMEGATGRLGSMVLTQRAGTGTVARTLAPEVSNPKSDAQQTRRVKWGNLVNFYKVSKGWMAKAFENKASNQSDYNKFMSLNANSTQVALTKDQASQGGVIAGPYTISQGSLPSINVTALEAGGYATDLRLGNLTIGLTTTVGQLSAALLDNNEKVKAGYQLSFISYQQQVNGVTGVPYVLCGYYEITLNTGDTRLVNDVMPVSFAAATVTTSEKYLGTGASLNSGAFAYVLSDRKGGKILTSTQQLIVNNNAEYNQAITNEALQAAIESYGRGQEVFLAPGYAGGGQSQSGENSALYVVIGANQYKPGINPIPISALKTSSNTINVAFANSVSNLTVSSLKMSGGGVEDFERTASNKLTNGVFVIVTSWNGSIASIADGNYITSLQIVLSDGSEYSLTFPSSTVID